MNDYAEWLNAPNMDPASEHPRDLTATSTDGEILIEAKTVKKSPQSATREAVGQLFEYSHFFYDEQGPQPIKVALFDEDIGDAFRHYLDKLEIAVVWPANGRWLGSDRAKKLDLCD